jgi:hypothetical protein
MNSSSIPICILLCLAILASGQAAAQGTYGTKVQAGDPDVGLPLSGFAGIGLPLQNAAFISYWDIGSNPGLYDDQDVAYLQFGSTNVPPALRVVRANNIRLTGWGVYPAGSYVKPGDSDIGQQLMVVPPQPPLPSAGQTAFYYMNVAGGAGYDLGDPVYLKAQSPPVPVITGTNDIRITANAGFPAGSRVSLNDADAGKALTPFMGPIPAAGGAFATAPVVSIATLMFFNANGNILGAPPGSAIFDDGDVVYFHVGVGGPGAAVSPNDIRLY